MKLLASDHYDAELSDCDTVDFPVTRYDMADYLGLTPETVSRALTQLKVSGIIRQVSPRWINILDSRGLKEIAGGNTRARHN